MEQINEGSPGHRAEKVDALEKRLAGRGIETVEDAFEEIVGELDKSPDDPELQRQANLLINRLEDFTTRLKSKVETHH